MGTETSAIAKTPISSDSYYGSGGNIDETQDMAQAYRTIQQEKFEEHQRARMKKSPQKVQLKTVVSIGDPAPFFKRIDNIILIGFGIKSETSASIILICEGQLNSITIPAGKRLTIYLPIPKPKDFQIDITPQQPQTSLDDNVTFVEKHLLLFHLEGYGFDISGEFLHQQLIINNGSKTVSIDTHQQLEWVDEITVGACLFCMQNNAEIQICNCSHKVACQNCVNTLNPHLCQCPYCN